MVKFRELINTCILNDTDWVGFLGDSEYINQYGELVMGFWAWLDQVEEGLETIYCLDDEIEDNEVFHSNTYRIRNDYGEICIIKLLYDKKNAK